VVFDPHNGQDSIVVAVDENAPIGELPEVERFGFVFLGWFEELDYLPGDVNGDGEVGIDDALQILRYLIGLSSILDDCENAVRAALIVSDDIPQVGDALQILRYLIGLPNELENFGEPLTTQTPIVASTTFIARWEFVK
jgi:hypothetical protein